MDIGIWLLSDRAVDLLMKRSQKADGALDVDTPYSDLKYYDLYADFGLSLGNHPRIEDEELNSLSVAILPLPGGEFYHYGTSRELLSSTVTLQNKGLRPAPDYAPEVEAQSGHLCAECRSASPPYSEERQSLD